MALAQFTQEFLAIINKQSPNDFWDTLHEAAAVNQINFISETLNKQRDFLPKFNWFNSKDDNKSENLRTTGNECFVRMEFVEALVSPRFISIISIKVYKSNSMFTEILQ